MSLQLLQQYVSDDEQDEGDSNVAVETLTPGESPTEVAPRPGTSRDAIFDDMVLKNNIINAREHGPVAPAPLEPKIESVRRTSDDDVIMDFKNPQETESSDSDTSEEDSGGSSSECDTDQNREFVNAVDGEDSDGDVRTTISKLNTRKQIIKIKGEIALEDLPPIEDLQITVPEKEVELIGTIYDIVDQLVIVESLPDKPSLDLDTVLFTDNGKNALGHVFDVFGQVTKPFYCVRFNSEDHISKRGISQGMCVFYAPKNGLTNYVFISELMRTKGSDASWKHDAEPPAQYVEYSDDEEERNAKRALKSKRSSSAKNSQTSSKNVEGVEGRQQPTAYEERMNRKNLMKTVESNRNTQQVNIRFDPFNPFSRPTGNPAGRYHDQSSEIRWGSVATGRGQRGAQYYNQTPRYWGWNMALPPMPPMMNVPPFMRPPRFTVPSAEWGAQPHQQQQYRPYTPTTSTSWWTMGSSPAPPGT